MSRVALGLVLLAILVVACSGPSPGRTIRVHGHPVTLRFVPGMSSHVGPQSRTVYLGRALRYGHEDWQRLLAHEVCHMIDHDAGYPSMGWLGDPTGLWEQRPQEAWAQACAHVWLGGAKDSIVGPQPDLRLRTGAAPAASAITRDDHERMCREVDRRTCPP